MDRTNFPGKNDQTDKSVLSGSKNTNAEYINECIKEVCIKEESLTKYKKYIEKEYPSDGFFDKCEKFVGEVTESVQRKKFTSTSIRNLEYLGKEILLDGSTIVDITKHFERKFKDEEKKELERQRKENERIAEEKRQKEQEAERARQEEQRRLAKIREEQQKKQNIKTIHTVAIIGLFAVSVIIVLSSGFSKSSWLPFMGISLIPMGIAYLLLYLKARQEYWTDDLWKWTKYIGIAYAAILVIITIVIFWETVLIIVGVIVGLAIIGGILSKVFD